MARLLSQQIDYLSMVMFFLNYKWYQYYNVLYIYVEQISVKLFTLEFREPLALLWGFLWRYQT